MRKKLVVLMVLCLVLGMFQTVSATSNYWNNNAKNQKWEDANNWSPKAVPSLTGTYNYIDIGNAGDSNECIIRSGVAGKTNKLFIASTVGSTGSLVVQASGSLDNKNEWYIGDKGIGTLTVNGGTVSNLNTASKSMYVGGWNTGATGTGILNITSGLVDISLTNCDLVLGLRGTGSLNMSGGTLKIGRYLTMATNSGSSGTINLSGGVINVAGTSVIYCPAAIAASTGVANINVTGGTINAGKINLPYFAGNSGKIKLIGGQINLTGVGLNMSTGGKLEVGYPGKLISAGDKLTTYQGYIDAGWITGYHSAELLMSVVDGNTVLTSVPVDANIAWAPNPSDKATGVDKGLSSLSWAPGNLANKHDVYFGYTFADVNNATTATSGIYKGRIDPNSYSPINLTYRQTCYWRIDEVNIALGKVWKGKVWTFTVPDNKVLETFEDYNNINPNTGMVYDPPYTRSIYSGYTPPVPVGAIWAKWKDGFDRYLCNGNAGSSGSIIYDGGVIKYAGKKSVQFTYDNDGDVSTSGYQWFPPKYSEMEANSPVTDMSGFQSIQLYYMGATGNSAEKMYMALSDGTNTAVVFNSDTYAAQNNVWTVWHIKLQDFIVDKPALNLSNIKKIIVGMGNRKAPVTGGSGTMYFDDIRLYVQTCFSDLVPGGLAGGDCISNFTDVNVMTQDWLMSGGTIYASAPDDSHCRVYYKFDEGSGYDTVDSSGKGNTGTVTTSSAWTTDGYSNGSLDFSFSNTVRVYVPMTVFTDVNSQVTISMWVNGSTVPPVTQRQFAFHGCTDPVYGGANGHILSMNLPNNNAIVFESGHISPQQSGWASYFWGWDTTAWNEPPSDAFRGQWNHFAVTKNAQTGIQRVYHNGLIVAESTNAFVPLRNYMQSFLIGGFNLSGTTGLPYVGKIDEFRVYDYALSQAEIIQLAGKSSLYVPVRSTADLNGDDKINLIDFSYLAENWLQEVLWPY
jgi:T5SS/PEP-CTERM-associated repeat protein